MVDNVISLLKRQPWEYIQLWCCASSRSFTLAIVLFSISLLSFSSFVISLLSGPFPTVHVSSLHSCLCPSPQLHCPSRITTLSFFYMYLRDFLSAWFFQLSFFSSLADPPVYAERIPCACIYQWSHQRPQCQFSTVMILDVASIVSQEAAVTTSCTECTITRCNCKVLAFLHLFASQMCKACEWLVLSLLTLSTFVCLLVCPHISHAHFYYITRYSAVLTAINCINVLGVCRRRYSKQVQFDACDDTVFTSYRCQLKPFIVLCLVTLVSDCVGADRQQFYSRSQLELTCCCMS